MIGILTTDYAVFKSSVTLLFGKNAPVVVVNTASASVTAFSAVEALQQGVLVGKFGTLSSNFSTDFPDAIPVGAQNTYVGGNVVVS